MQSANILPSNMWLRGYRHHDIGRQHNATAEAAICLCDMVENTCSCMHFLVYNADYEAVMKIEGAKMFPPFSSRVLLFAPAE